MYNISDDIIKFLRFFFTKLFQIHHEYPHVTHFKIFVRDGRSEAPIYLEVLHF